MKTLGFKGHPLHVILVDLPIGLWIGSLAADVAALATGDPFWSRAAWWAMAGGIVTALGAAVPGIVDFFRSVPPESAARDAARRHGWLNVGLVGLFTLNLLWRGSELAPGQPGWIWAFALSVIGVGALAYSGWLGGEMVHAYGMGLERLQAGGEPTVYGGRVEGAPGEPVDVATEDELAPDQVKHVVVNGAWVLVCRTATGWHAVDGRCTHQGAPLCDGMLVHGKIQCPWHGSRFDVATGAVEAGPAKAPLEVWKVDVAGGRVRVTAPPGGAG